MSAKAASLLEAHAFKRLSVHTIMATGMSLARYGAVHGLAPAAVSAQAQGVCDAFSGCLQAWQDDKSLVVSRSVYQRVSCAFVEALRLQLRALRAINFAGVDLARLLKVACRSGEGAAAVIRAMARLRGVPLEGLVDHVFSRRAPAG